MLENIFTRNFAKTTQNFIDILGIESIRIKITLSFFGTTVPTTEITREELIESLEFAGFPLRKWNSKNLNVLQKNTLGRSKLVSNPT